MRPEYVRRMSSADRAAVIVEPAGERPVRAQWPKPFIVARQHAENLRYERWKGQMRLEMWRARDNVRRESPNHIMRSLRDFGRRHAWIMAFYRPWGW